MRFDYPRLLCVLLAGIVLIATDHAATAPRSAQELRRLDPVDEADRDPSFQAFRDRLLVAAQRRDKATVLGSTSPDIEYSLEADPGIKGFEKYWMIDQSRRFWRELETVLRLGATVTEMTDQGPREFCAPYVYGMWPDELDSLDHRAIIASDVKVRAAAAADAIVIATLSYDLVRTEFVADRRQPRDDLGPIWVKVILPEGISGFVHRDSIRDVSDVHACFRKIGQRWQMRAFITGD